MLVSPKHVTTIIIVKIVLYLMHRRIIKKRVIFSYEEVRVLRMHISLKCETFIYMYYEQNCMQYQYGVAT